jgi:hypothetical protein
MNLYETFLVFRRLLIKFVCIFILLFVYFFLS